VSLSPHPSVQKLPPNQKKGSSSQPQIRSRQSEGGVSLDDINVGLRGLESYDLRGLSQPTTCDEYEAGNVGGSEDDVVSFDNEDEAVNNPPLDEEIPTHIDLTNVDDDGNPTCNLWSKIYQNSRMWARNTDSSVSITIGDMFVDKDQWSEVLREFAIQEGFATQKIKNEKYRHIVRCKDNKCDWRIHCSRLCDEVTWKVKSVKGKHMCAKFVHNTMASSSWVATELLALFKENPTMDYLTMQNYLMERLGIAVPAYVCQRAKKLLREWVEGKHGESYARLHEYIGVIKEKNLGTIASFITEGLKVHPSSRDCSSHLRP